MSAYTSTRPRGFAPWSPHAKTRALLDQVEAVLEDYADHLPLTVRQVFYRLVAAFDYPKEESAYARLQEALVRARRAEMIPFESIRDDGPVEADPGGFHGLPGFWSSVRAWAEDYRRLRLAGQPRALEVWGEAAGMVPQLARVAHRYGVPVYSSGGFDSLTAKYEAARRIVGRDRPTVVLSVGDLDPSGAAMFDAAEEDVAQFVRGLGGAEPEFVRVAVTRQQVAEYGLPEKPAKATDQRGDWRGGTVQAEALSPPDLAAELEDAIRRRLDLDAYGEIMAREEEERRTLLGRLSELMGPED